MTDKDKELISKAERLNYIDWYRAEDMANEADTDEAKIELHHIAMDLYHLEEYYADIL